MSGAHAGCFTAEGCEAQLDKGFGLPQTFLQCCGQSPSWPPIPSVYPMLFNMVCHQWGLLCGSGSAAVQQLAQSWAQHHVVKHPTVPVGISVMLRSFVGDRQNYSGSPLHISALLLTASNPTLLTPNWRWHNKKCLFTLGVSA